MRGGGRGRVERRGHVDQHLVAATGAAEFEVRERGAGQVARLVQPQVFLGDAAEERAQEIAGERACRLRGVARHAPDYLLEECETGSGNLAEHAVSLWKGRGVSEKARDYTAAPSFGLRGTDFHRAA